MALAHAILAILIDFPGSGYEINKRFEQSVGCFWKATHQQIYRELGKLEGLGWVDGELIPQEGRPDKKVYQVTELGKQELICWIGEPSEPTPLKEEILVKMFVGQLVDLGQIQQAISHHRLLYEDRLAMYRAIEATHFPEGCLRSAAEQFRYLTLRKGIRDAMDWIGWCDEALEQMAEMLQEKGIGE